MSIKWNAIQNIKSRKFVCGYCGNKVASNKGWEGINIFKDQKYYDYIYICHYCRNPTYIKSGGEQIPGIKYGNDVEGLPQDIESLYEEARNCTKTNSFTASVMCCRKLLINIAVSKGADEGNSFESYVEYLSNKGYIPPDGKDWVNRIRNKSNEANHEIKLMGKEDAEELISFVEMLLKFIYEYPTRIEEKNLQEE